MTRDVAGIVELASAYYGSATLFAAIDAGLFEKAERGALSGVARSERLLADACVALGLLEKSAEGVYSNTPAGRAALLPGSPADLTGAIRYNRDVYPVWGRLAEFARTGRPVERPSIHLGGDAERTRAFAAAMYGRAMGIGRGIVPMLGHLRGRLLDLAGGPGAYAILACRANPGLEVVTVDLPPISAIAQGYVAEAGLSGSIECRPGDWHEGRFGENEYDFATIFGALHQEKPEDIVSILRAAAAALKPGGRLFVLDMMTDATRAAPAFSALFALNMALTTENGWVFSDEDLKGWMREAGLAPGVTRCAPPPMPHWLVEGVKE